MLNPMLLFALCFIIGNGVLVIIILGFEIETGRGLEYDIRSGLAGIVFWSGIITLGYYFGYWRKANTIKSKGVV